MIQQADPETEQYSLTIILAIWASVTVPMALLAWVVTPWAIPRTGLHPGITFWLMMTLGMSWQFVVSVIMLRHEGYGLDWQRLEKRLWLVTPQSPATGKPSKWLYLWIIPCFGFVGLTELPFVGLLDAPLSSLEPAHARLEDLNSPEFRGAWWLLGLAIVSSIFNYLLGEALLFHGVLLPKMQGVFGRWAWLANAVLFGLYHLHKIWAVPTIILSTMAYSWPAQRFRSVWLAVFVHGLEGVILFAIVLAVILGAGPGAP